MREHAGMLTKPRRPLNHKEPTQLESHNSFGFISKLIWVYRLG
jgi:hypothetical protein